MKRKLSLLMLLTMLSMVGYAAGLKTYPAPDGAPLNDDFTLLVRQPGGTWQTVPTYLWKVDNAISGKHSVENTSVASFDFDFSTGQAVELAVVSRRQRVDSCRVRPLSYDIKHTVNGDTIRFSLTESRYVSVEVNGDIFHNLQIFANNPAPVVTKEMRKSKSFIYYGPGYYDLGGDSISIPTGATVYIDGGAYIKGWMSVYGARNVKVIGHGMVNPERQHEGIMVRYSDNVVIDGPFTTQIPVGGSSSVRVRNAKVMSWYGWGDGMNVFASNHVSYEHVFCRTRGVN